MPRISWVKKSRKRLRRKKKKNRRDKSYFWGWLCLSFHSIFMAEGIETLEMLIKYISQG